MRQSETARAQDMLRASPKARVTDIAFMLGYKNLETFSRAFRRREGMSPREYQHIAGAITISRG